LVLELLEGDDMHEEVELGDHPDRKGDVAHEIVKKSQIVNSRVRGQKRDSDAHEDHGQDQPFLAVDFEAEHLNDGVQLELVADVAVDGLHQTELGVDSEQDHR
jgi:hypothetical protein